LAVYLQTAAPEQNDERVLCALDFSKYFDRVQWKVVIHMMQCLGIPANLQRAIHAWWQGMRRTWQCGQAVGSFIEALQGLPPGCPLSPILSLLVLMAALDAHIYHFVC
jgi:hypothetical protein